MKDSLIKEEHEASTNKKLIDKTVDLLQGKSKREIDDFMENLSYEIKRNYVLKKD